LATGLDLVQWQLRIAAGEPLTIRQQDVKWSGSAIECRIYAEDPANNFLPSPGKITYLEQPSGPGIRLDSGVYQGWTVPLDYDPLLAKMAVWAPSRDAAIARMRRALSEYVVEGIRTNIAWFDEILADESFRAGDLSTAFLEKFHARGPADADLETEAVAALIASLQQSKPQPAAPTKSSAWLAAGRAEMMR
jgi:acetyl-CoA carboxylase biotin carboxylase subunit